MAFAETSILESDAPGIAAADFDFVSLVGLDGAIGATVSNKFGLEADMDQIALRVGRKLSRLLVAVADPHSAETVARVRSSLKWAGSIPF